MRAPRRVRQIALAPGGGPTQADVDARGASIDADSCGDLVGVERQDTGGADRADVTGESHVRKVIHEFKAV